MTQNTVRSVRRAFLAGAIVLAPLAVTVWVFVKLISFIGGPGQKLFEYILPEALFQRTEALWTFVAAVIVLILVTLLGYLSRYVAGKFMFSQAERVMRRVPLIGAVYNTSKQIIETFSVQRRAVFEKVVVVPFPRPGSYVIAFLTNRVRTEAHEVTGEDLYHVFVPTTPNPTSGFLILVPSRDVHELQMSIGEGMKLIISGGAVVPTWPRAPAATASVPDTAVVPPGNEAGA